MQISRQKRWKKKVQTFVEVLYMSSLWTKYKAWILSFLALFRAGFLSSLNTTLQTTISSARMSSKPALKLVLPVQVNLFVHGAGRRLIQRD